jgi:hypothetical protein
MSAGAAELAEEHSLSLARELADLPRTVAVRIARRLRAELELAEPDPDLMARVGAGWVSALEDLAKHNPAAAAGGLAAGMLAHLRRYRPETPAPLDSGFAPTEQVPTRPPT